MGELRCSFREVGVFEGLGPVRGKRSGGIAVLQVGR